MSGFSRVLCVTPSSSGGWGPITALAHLAGRLLDAPVDFRHPVQHYSVPLRIRSLAPRMPQRSGGPLLAIVAHPGNLLSLAEWDVLRRRHDPIAVWVIDSFWDDRLPRFAKRGGDFDLIAVTDGELVADYEAATSTQAIWLPWGADVLRQAALPSVERDTDVLRVGRQPEGWADDEASERILAAAGIRFDGGAPISEDGLENQRLLHEHMRRSKLVMAWSNAKSPGTYTHPTREYLTARWTDAVACGARVVGIPPQCQATSLIPETGLVRLSSTEEAEFIAAVRLAVDEWSEAGATDLQRRAARQLDWRLRLEQLCSVLEVSAPALETELRDLLAFADGVR